MNPSPSAELTRPQKKWLEALRYCPASLYIHPLEILAMAYLIAGEDGDALWLPKTEVYLRSQHWVGMAVPFAAPIDFDEELPATVFADQIEKHASVLFGDRS